MPPILTPPSILLPTRMTGHAVVAQLGLHPIRLRGSAWPKCLVAPTQMPSILTPPSILLPTRMTGHAVVAQLGLHPIRLRGSACDSSLFRADALLVYLRIRGTPLGFLFSPGFLG